MLDLNVEICDTQDVIKRSVNLVEKTNPEVLGLTCWTVHAPFVVEFVRRYKKHHPNVYIVLGGVHASASVSQMMTLCPADAIVHSEGEQTLLELLQVLGKKDKLSNVKGISYRGNGRILTTDERPLIQNLDEISFPNYEMLQPIQKYQPFNHEYIFSINATRGCNHNCAFCSGNSFWRCQRWRSAENIINEINWLKTKYDVGFIRFEDDDLLSNKTWAKHLLKLLPGVIPPFSCLARFDSMEDDFITLLSAAGCIEVYHGLETTSIRLLKILRKGHTRFDLKQIKELVSKEITFGLIPTISAMIGIPTETEDEMHSTIDYLLELRALGARTQLWLLTPYPDTEIVRKHGNKLVQVDRWRRFGQFDVFSEAAHEAYDKLIQKYNFIVPDWWMFANEAGIDKTGKIYSQTKGNIMGVFDFV